MEKMQLESRLMKSMVPTLYQSGVDDIVKKLTEDPKQVGDNALKMLRDILRSQLGMYARDQVINLFFAGILCARAMDESPEFREVAQKWLDDDDASGRNRILNFSEARAKMKGFI